MNFNEVDNNRHEFRDGVKKHRVQIGALMLAGVLIVISPNIIGAISDSQQDEDNLTKLPEATQLVCGIDENGNEILLTLDEIHAMSSPPPVCVPIKGTGFIKSVGISPESLPTSEKFESGYLGPVGENAKE